MSTYDAIRAQLAHLPDWHRSQWPDLYPKEDMEAAIGTS